jgi:biotin carboxylase
MKKKVLFTVLIPDAESGHALPVIRCLSEIKGLVIHTLSKDPKASLRYSLRSRSFRIAEIDENNELKADFIIKAIRRTNADIIFPVDEAAVNFFSRNLEQFKKIVDLPPIPSVDVFQKSINKYLLAEFLGDNDIPSPLTIFAGKTDEFYSKLKSMHFPVLAKPAIGNGGIGIQRLNNYEKAEKFFKEELNGFFGDYVAQEFIDGYDIDCSILCRDGEIIAYTIQRGIIPRARSFAAPGGIQFLKNDDLLNVVNRFVKQLKYNGIAHIDLRYDNLTKTYKILDVNARYWGSLTGSLLAGVNFPYLACLMAKGIKFKKPEFNHGFYTDHITATRKLIRGIFHKTDQKIRFKETDYKYILQDPIAEIYNIFRRKAHR